MPHIAGDASSGSPGGRARPARAPASRGCQDSAREVVVAFDTHRFVKTLTANGFTEKQPEVLANEQGNLLNSNLVTKADIQSVNERLEALRSDAAKRIAELKADLQRWTITVIATVAGILLAVGGLVVALLRLLRGTERVRSGPDCGRRAATRAGRCVPDRRRVPKADSATGSRPSRTRRSLTARGSRRGTPGEEAGAPVYADLPGTLVSSGGVEYALYDGMRGTVRIPVRRERFIVALWPALRQGK